MIDDPRIPAALAHNDTIGGSRFIEYGGMMIMVPVRDIRQAMDALRTGDKAVMMASVNATLARTFPAVKAGTATNKQAMECGQDIAIWFANEVVEGRASVEVS